MAAPSAENSLAGKGHGFSCSEECVGEENRNGRCLRTGAGVEWTRASGNGGLRAVLEAWGRCGVGAAWGKKVFLE